MGWEKWGHIKVKVVKTKQKTISLKTLESFFCKTKVHSIVCEK